MAKSSGLAQQFFIHGFDISGDVGAINNAGSPRATLEVTAIDVSAMERLLGPSDGILDFSSWFDSAAGASHAALSTLPTTDVILLWALGGSAGDDAAGLVAKQMNYDADRGADGSLAFQVTALANAVALEWCDMLTAGKITHASATSSTSVQQSATSDGMAGYLEMVDIDSGTPTVLIEESSDNGSGDAFATIIAFTAIADGAEPTAERKTVAGAVEADLRVTTTGTFSNADFAVAIRRGESVDDTAYT